jgi:hypothetical protein
LGDGYYVVEEGLNGRTATLEHPWIDGRNGRSYLLAGCRSHAPLDLIRSPKWSRRSCADLRRGLQ